MVIGAVFFLGRPGPGTPSSAKAGFPGRANYTASELRRVSTMDYVRRYVQHADEYYGLIVVSVLGMVLLPASGEMLTAYVALELLTRGAGLSLGDRMCLSLARALDLPAYMADRTWANVSVDVKIVVIR